MNTNISKIFCHCLAIVAIAFASPALFAQQSDQQADEKEEVEKKSGDKDDDKENKKDGKSDKSDSKKPQSSPTGLWKWTLGAVLLSRMVRERDKQTRWSLDALAKLLEGGRPITAKSQGYTQMIAAYLIEHGAITEPSDRTFELKRRAKADR